jgi:hypothetical protein
MESSTFLKTRFSLAAIFNNPRQTILSFFVVLILISPFNILNAQTPVVEVPADTKPFAVKSWLVAGPFQSPDANLKTEWDAKRTGYSTDFLKSIGGESNAIISKGTAIKTEDGKIVKFKAHRWKNDYLDLNDVYGELSNVCVYFYTELLSKTDQTIAIHIGTNDAGKLWVNGKLLASHTGDRGASHSQNTAIVKLKAGHKTPVLLKIDQGGGGWGAYVDIYGLTAHQDYVEANLPKNLNIQISNYYPAPGDTINAHLINYASLGSELDVPVKWVLKNGAKTREFNSDSDEISFVIPKKFNGKSILYATKKVNNHKIQGVLKFIVREKEEKIFPEDDEALNIGDRRELFVDYYLIHKIIDARLVLHEPRDEGTVLKFDKPWEGPFSAYCTIIKDDKKYRAYYRGEPVAGSDGNPNEVTCYAESDDGIHWTKPNLGIYEIMGTRDNNVILANEVPFTHNFSPFLDSNPDASPDEKFKALGGVEKSGLFGFSSKDGIHWKKMRSTPLFTKGSFDSQNVSFWSESEQCYVLYFRTWTGPYYSGIRTISRSTSKDFIHWTEPVRMDFGYTPLEHIYTNQTSPYFRAKHIYVSIAARFMPGRQVINEEQALKLKVNPKYFRDCSDIIFMTSRGGNRYDRTFMGALVKPGIGLQNWVSRSNYPALNVVQTGDEEMSLYISHDNAQPTKHIRRYSLRLDGFASLRADYAGGEVITKKLTFKGDKLILNFATSAAGYIKVEIEDADGKAIEGFELENSYELIGNEIEKIVLWKNNPDLKQLNGKQVRLRFVLKDADLYSIKFD